MSEKIKKALRMAVNVGCSFEGDAEDAASLLGLIEANEARIAELEGIIKSDNERLIEAGLKVNLYSGCDTAETMAEEILASRARIAECESALISMVQQFFYSKADENIFRHAFMSAEEEAADYLVEHGIARWADKRKSSIYFNEVQE